jgi:hypothetical protein
VIRAGSNGRLRFDPAHREALLDAFERGGTSAMAFARDHGVKYPTFIAWLNKRHARREETADAVDRPAFAEVPLDGPLIQSAAVPLRVVLPCGAAIEICHRAALPLAVELLASLRRPC